MLLKPGLEPSMPRLQADWFFLSSGYFPDFWSETEKCRRAQFRGTELAEA